MKLCEYSGWRPGWPDWILTPGEVMRTFQKVSAMGIKNIEMTEHELENFLQAFCEQIPAETNVASGKFIFWGVQIIKIES